MKAILYTDGGARGNPGPAGIGVVLQDTEGNLIAQRAESIGYATNNLAEYKALVAGLEEALARGATALDVYLDSELVVHQMNGEWKIKNDQLRSLAARAQALASRFESVSFGHVRRGINAHADRLANEAMDAAEQGATGPIDAVEQSSFFDEDPHETE